MTNRWQVWVIILWIQQGHVLKLWHRFPRASAAIEGRERKKNCTTDELSHKWLTCVSKWQICDHSDSEYITKENMLRVSDP